MELSQFFVFAAIGLTAGIGSGLFGIGGGVIIVPLLVFFIGLGQKTASATSLVAMILPVGILGVWQYYKAGVITTTHIRMGLLISVGMFLGTLVGSKLSLALPTKIISRGFALLLVYVSIRLWLQSNK
jgi:uncharacterized membrane protein YfcA